MKVLFVYPGFQRHAEANPERLDYVPMNEYLGSPSLGIATLAAVTPDHWEIEYRDDRLAPADYETDADVVALSFFTAAAERGMALGDRFRAMGKHTVAGGIFTTMMPEESAPHFDTIIVGEAEDSWRRFLADFERGEARARYDCEGPVDLESLPLPRLDLYFGAENGTNFMPDDYPLQVSRGCPLKCHSCALPRTMGNKIRAFSTQHVIGQLDLMTQAGKRACLTEDTSWFPAGKGRRRLRELVKHVHETGQHMAISYIGISMPMILSTPMSFLERCKEAGIDMFYLVGGFDPVTMGAFTGDQPKRLQQAHDAIAKSHDVGIIPYTSFLLGNDDDDEGTVDRMLEFGLKSKLMKAEFAIATPYPGTPRWYQLLEEGRILHRRWGQYNDANVVFQPKHFTPEGLKQGYLRLWREFYADKRHMLEADHVTRTIQF